MKTEPSLIQRSEINRMVGDNHARRTCSIIKISPHFGADYSVMDSALLSQYAAKSRV